MDLRQLRYFLAICDDGAFTRAAERLRVAQPALSAHVKALEEELGVELLLRTARGVVPTEQGARLAAHARRILAEVESLRDDIRGAGSVPSGPVAVGIPTSLGMVLTVPLALAVRRALPQVTLRIAEGLSGHTLEWLRAGQLDLAIVFDVDTPQRLALTPLAQEGLWVIGPKDDPLLTAAGAAGLPFAEAAGLPLILTGAPHGLRREVERTARETGAPLNVILELDALEHIKALVEGGAGYAILSRRVAARELDQGRLAGAAIIAPTIDRTIQLAHPSDRPLSIAAGAVRGLLLDIVADLTRDGQWR
ncbi:LysR substrate-binding domain-containing protein [Caenispirillum bisanense]|uniref:LysR substrate-binding domain-containing protein n=1 Tax=Caenispirillum bisanense TaxID=414052 RepID=UPI0031D7C8EF